MANILIVDDSKISRKILRNLLEKNGHIVVGEAENGQIAINKYLELKPDITTLDITMPVLDGIGALNKIRSLDEDAKVIMVTAAGQQNKILEALKGGASEFLTKPFEPERIIDAIEKLMK